MKSFDTKSFGAKVQKLREQYQLSVKELASIIKMSTTNIGRIERGEICVKIDTACRLAEAFGVSVDFLCDRESNEDQKGPSICIDLDSPLPQKKARVIENMAKFLVEELEEI